MRPIDAEVFAERMMNLWDTADKKKKADIVAILANIVVPILVGTPTLDYAPVVHASWIRQDDTYTRFQCGECKSENFDRRWVFCPLCGAKMDGGKSE